MAEWESSIPKITATLYTMPRWGASSIEYNKKIQYLQNKSQHLTNLYKLYLHNHNHTFYFLPEDFQDKNGKTALY